MKISRNWLQGFFTSPLPEAQVLADALTFHAFEIESVEGDILDVKVTPNRGHDCLCHRGIAKELSAILKVPLNAERDPFAKKPDLSKKTDAVVVAVEDAKLCRRYIAGYIRGVKVGPSPEWLRTSLEAIGQRSINNVVDATNLVMFNTGQPLHAFDAGKLSAKGGKYSIAVRLAKKGETMLALDDKEYALSPSNLAIVDANADTVIGIAGVKGGKPTGVDEKTTDIILEAANFDGVSVRRTAASLKLRTDASDRFQQAISPELAAYGMQQAVEIIAAIAGGKTESFVDVYPAPQEPWTVAVSTEKVNKILGTSLSEADVADAFTRLGLPFEKKGGDFVVTPPFERLDIVIPEDLIEEVARIVGYDKIPATALPLDPARGKPHVNANFYAAEETREALMARGYSEIFTSVFADRGERVVANKVDGVRPYLRSTLVDGLRAAREMNERNKSLLGLTHVRLFEIGTVWKGGKEQVMVGMADEENVSELPLEADTKASAYQELPVSALERYQSFSRYPFIVRDIAMWIPESPSAFSEAVAVFAEYNRGLLRHVDLFDQYKKDGRVSYAFHLVFQSFEKTLTDEEANAVMADIYAAVKAKGWEVR
jgi:phenylalanyl-tRNA synthetase beta chain